MAPAKVARGLHRRLTARAGWRRAALAVGVGAVSTLALPPAFAWPVLYATIPALIWLVGAAGTWRGRAWVGWCFGFGYFTAGLYWISNAPLVASDDFWWMVPFAAVGLPMFLALFHALAMALGGWPRDPLARALGLVGALAGVEWLRGWVLTGFPWNLIGYAWAGSDWMMQSAAWIGVHGMGVLLLLSAALPAAALTARRPLPLLVGAAAIPVLIAAAGAWRLAQAPPLDGTRDAAPVAAETIGLRLVQPGIPQREKWGRAFQRRNFDLHLALSAEGRPDWVAHVIWPETAAAFFLADAPGALAEIAAVVPPGGYLITGAPRRDGDPPRLFNSLLVVDGGGHVAARYDKAHLVPFGEYVPLADWLPIRQVAQGASGYAPGPGLVTLTLPGLPAVGPLICYEAIFPGKVVDSAAPPKWLLNLTNDAWYGHTAGPHQHWTQTRLRAVEEGMPMVRVASTGITAVADPWGRVLGLLPLGAHGVLDVKIQLHNDMSTPYARLQNLPFFVLVLVMAASSGILHARHGAPTRSSKGDGTGRA